MKHLQLQAYNNQEFTHLPSPYNIQYTNYIKTYTNYIKPKVA